MQRNNIKFKQGFGLLEVLVSSVIIITILAALVFVGRAALSNSTYLQERAQAIYLAQDAIEKIRHIRDNAWIDGDSVTTTEWDSWEFNSATSPTGFISVTNKNYILNLAIVNGSDKQKYGLIPDFGAGDDVAIDGVTFNRKITVSDVGDLIPAKASGDTTDVNKDKNAKKINVTVNWKFKGLDKSLSVSEVLTNWRPNY